VYTTSCLALVRERTLHDHHGGGLLIAAAANAGGHVGPVIGGGARWRRLVL